MAYYDRDEVLQGIHEEMYAQREDSKPSGFAMLDKESKTWVGVGFGLIALGVILEKITFNQGLGMVVAGVVAIYLMHGSQPSRGELTWLECMIRLYDLLEFLQKHPIGHSYQIPKGKITVTPIGRKQWYEGKAFKRSFGVNIYDQTFDVDETYYIEVDIFTGDIITFRHSPGGVVGDETRDVKLIASPDMLMVKKREEYLGRAIKT